MVACGELRGVIGVGLVDNVQYVIVVTIVGSGVHYA